MATVLQFPAPEYEFEPLPVVHNAAACARLIGSAGPDAALALAMALLEILPAKDKARLAKRFADSEPSDGKRGDAVRQAAALVRYSMAPPSEKAVIGAYANAWIDRS